MIVARVVALGLAGIVLTGALAAAPERLAGPAVVGVLENPPFGCTHPDSAVVPFGVRPLFATSGGRWTAIDDREPFRRTISSPMSWTVAFDGKNIGSIRTTTPKPQRGRYWSVIDQWLQLAPGQKPPQRETPALRYEGWCNAPERPLVVVTPANFADPESWKPFAPSPDLHETLLPTLRASLDSIFICGGRNEQPPVFRYTAQDLVVVRAYRNRGGRTIVGVRFTERSACSNDETELDAQATHWVALGGEPAFLGTGLQLVDAGDYDADGKSELVFAFSGYDRDGYTLFADDFRKRADVRWGYH